MSDLAFICAYITILALPACVRSEPVGATPVQSSTEGSGESSSGPDMDTDASTGSSESTNGSIPGCECITNQDEDGDGQDNLGPLLPTCGVELCDNVDACIGEGCELPKTEFAVDSAALECALMALRDQSPGLLMWSITDLPGYTDFGYLLINDDGSAVRRDSRREDQSTNTDDAILGTPPTSAFYDACLAETDEQVRFECVRAELESFAATCDEAFGCPGCG